MEKNGLFLIQRPQLRCKAAELYIDIWARQSGGGPAQQSALRDTKCLVCSVLNNTTITPAMFLVNMLGCRLCPTCIEVLTAPRYSSRGREDYVMVRREEVWLGGHHSARTTGARFMNCARNTRTLLSHSGEGTHVL